MRQIQLRLRTLLLLIAVFAFAFGAFALHRRAARFQMLSARHTEELHEWKSMQDMGMPWGSMRDASGVSIGSYDVQVMIKHHRELKQKYDYAVLHPWLPVPSDPPPP